MKKAMIPALIVFLLFSLVACNQKTITEPGEYIPNTQAEIVVAYIYNGKANIVTRQNNDVKLKSITLACVYYDASGQQIGNLNMTDCEIIDQKNVTLWQTECPETAVYMDCAIYSTTQENGTETTAEHIDLWETTVVSEFRIDTYSESLREKLGDNAALAVTNPYAILGSVRWQDLSVTVEMSLLSDNIQSVYLFALWFDAQGQPLDLQACSYCANGESMVAHIQSEDNHNYIFKAPGNAKSAKVIVQSADLKDGTQWVNPYFYEWLFVNQSSAE